MRISEIENRFPPGVSFIGAHRAGAGEVRFYHSPRGVFIVRVYDGDSGWDIYVPVHDGALSTNTLTALEEWINAKR